MAHAYKQVCIWRRRKLDQKVIAQLLVLILPETNSTYYGEKKARRKAGIEIFLILILLKNVI